MKQQLLAVCFLLAIAAGASHQVAAFDPEQTAFDFAMGRGFVQGFGQGLYKNPNYQIHGECFGSNVI